MGGPALSLLLALWVQGALALVLLWVLGARRLPLVRRREIAVDDIAVSKEPWPETARVASNAFDNQFQLPVLLFVAGGMAFVLGVSVFEAILAWAFVASRLVHAYIHLTSNHVIQRFTAYVVGVAILAVLWMGLLVRIVLAFGAV